MAPSARAITSTVGWSITAASIFSSFTDPTSKVLIFTAPSELNKVNQGAEFLPTMPLSRAVLLPTIVIGAPVSKTSRYGPLPLIFTRTAMCLLRSVSKGTTTVLGVSARTAQTHPAQASTTQAHGRRRVG